MLKKFRDRLVAIKNESKAILDAADKESGLLSTDQETNFDALMAEAKQVEASIKRHEQAEAMQASAGRSVEPAAPQSPTANPDIEIGGPNSEKDEWSGFKGAADFGSSVAAACSKINPFVDPRLRREAPGADAPSNFHRETGSDDGYMVPVAMSNRIWEIITEEEGILSLTNPEPTSANFIEMIGDESTPWGSTGVQANWGDEGAQFTSSRLSTDKRLTPLHKIHSYVLATEEIRDDAPRLESRLTKGAGKAMSWKIDEAIVGGTGAGQPLGWQTSSALVTVAKEAGQAADTIDPANLTKMLQRLLRTDARGAFWMCSTTLLTQLTEMTIGNQPVYTLPIQGGLQETPVDRLLGLPIKWSEHMQTLGDLNDINLVAPAGYYSAVRSGGVKFAASMHLFFDYDMMAFRWTTRVGGQPHLKTPVTPANNSETKSHFITLAARA